MFSLNKELYFPRGLRSCLGLVHTSADPKVFGSVYTETHKLIRVHTSVFVSYPTVHTKTHRIRHVTLCKHFMTCLLLLRMLEKARLQYFRYNWRHRFHFYSDPTVYTDTLGRIKVCGSVLLHFRERFQKYADPVNTICVLVWTEGLNATKSIRIRSYPY